MGREPYTHRQLADGKPHGGPQPAAAAQLHQHHGQQRKQHDILYNTHTRVGHKQQQRPQPDEIPVPVPRVGERLQRGGIGTLGAGGPILFYVPGQVVGQGLEVIHIVGRVGHHGLQGRQFVGAGGLKQHQRVGVVVHLKELEAQIFRVQSLVLDRPGGVVDMLSHPFPRQGVGSQQQPKQYGQRTGKGGQCPQGKGSFLFLRAHGTPPH